jgi:aryl-alcohol dehydrogenase-like predicted oxidoreductase
MPAGSTPRRLGRAALPASPIGLGLAAVGRPAYINLGHERDLGSDRSVEALRERTHELLDAAWEGGVRYLDAARSYGLAEDFLGAWLRERSPTRDELTVASKWGYRYTGGWRLDAEEHEVKDLSAAHLRLQALETRERLGDHLRLYQIHSATLESGVLEDPAVQEELAALRADGIAVGLTTTGPEQAATIDRAVDGGAFDTVQATWNLHERSAGAALARAHAAGMGVIVKEAVANGRLTERGAPAPLRAAAEERGTTPDAVALAAALAQPWAGVVLSGAATVPMLRSNLAALDVTWDEALEARLAPLAEDPQAYWATRGELAWT